jgi:SAM-dependent methyltransferase
MYLASRGIQVDAFDASAGMIAQAKVHAKSATPVQHLPVQFRCLRTEALDTLTSDPPYDGVLSNFSGLNCISDLSAVARNLSRLVRPGGRAVFCLFGTLCLWEVFWYLSAGDCRKAFRRFRRNPTDAALTGPATITVYYPGVSEIRELFAPYFRLEKTQGVGVVVPPSYAASVVSKFPRLLRVAAAIDPFVGRLPIGRSIADHVLLTLERVKEQGA